MIDQSVLARLHLSAVLQNLEEIVVYDDEAGKLVQNWTHTLQFSCPGDIACHIEFGQGKCRVVPGATTMPTLGLSFPSAQSLNNMFTGNGKALPIPWMGVWHIGLLKGFDTLSKRLEFYLQPSEETLKNRDHFKFHVQALLYTSLFGVKEVAENDPKAKPFLKGVRDGILEFRIIDGPAAHVIVKDGKLYPNKGGAINPSCVMELSDIDSAYGLFTGSLDAMALIGSGQMRMTGFIPLADKINAALDRLPLYLN
ncbi:SCP2 sterol-binding domain-containing protein [bacterium]|nr:SCP2 sterol-binding domain-containing protein [bacterium]